MISFLTKSLVACAGVLVLVSTAFPSEEASARSISYELNIPAESLDSALQALALASHHKLFYRAELVSGKLSKELKGTYTTEEAVTRLLEGTSLSFEITPASVVLIKGPETVSRESSPGAADSPRSDQTPSTPGTSKEADKSGSLRMAQVDQGASSEDSSLKKEGDEESKKKIAEQEKGIPAILVVGSRSMDVDIERTRDDVQPYVVFDAAQIQQSNARNLQEFLNTRLPMNAQQGPQSLVNPVNGDRSQINLRGLGANQTLILIDGRRMPNYSNVGTFGQPDINGIPIAAIERIEILPATASGIYGGGATGGVINIITKKGYSGADISLGYGNTTRTDSGNTDLEGTYGFNLDGGKTQVLLTGSHRTDDGLLVGDRDLAARGRELQFENNPAAFFSGRPPTGATSNITSLDGSNLQLKPQYGGTNLNSPFTYIPFGYAGIATGGGAPLVANAGKYNLGLADDILGGRNSLLPQTEVNSASADVRRDFTDQITGFVDLGWYKNRARELGTASFRSTATVDADAPTNPFTVPVRVTYPVVGLNVPILNTSETLRATGGLIVHLPWNWTASADYTWGRAETDLVRTAPPIGDAGAAALSDGALDVLKDLNAYPLNLSPYRLPSPNERLDDFNYMNDAVLRFSGPLFKLPGGALTLSGAIESRKDSASAYQDFYLNTDGSAALDYSAPLQQTNTSEYLEATVPLFSAANALPWVRELEIQLSGRHDQYTTRAASPTLVTVAPTDPLPAFTYSENKTSHNSFTAGIHYAPSQDLALRASYGTGFLPPSIDQIVPNAVGSTNFSFIDPKRGNTTSDYFYNYQTGGNINLKPETSKSWSLGVVLTPQALTGTRLSVDYTRIEKFGEITNFTDFQTLLNNEGVLAGRVTRAPLTPADQALGYTGGEVTFLDITAINIAKTDLKAFDIQADQTLKSAHLGDFHAYLIATYQPQLDREILPTTPTMASAGYTGGVLKWRGNIGLDWSRGSWSAGWNAQYYDSYFVYAAGSDAGVIGAAILNQGSARIPSQLYNDVYLKYLFDSQNRFLRGTEIAVGVQNLFDKNPPIIATTTLGGYSSYADPRLQRFTITLRKTFGGASPR